MTYAGDQRQLWESPDIVGSMHIGGCELTRAVCTLQTATHLDMITPFARRACVEL